MGGQVSNPESSEVHRRNLKSVNQNSTSKFLGLSLSNTILVKNTLFVVLNYADSVQLNGEGEYNLKSIKQEQATESFLGLDKAVRGCQNEEHYDECTTRQYIENMREKCGCLPLSIALSDQVNFLFIP